MSVLIDHEAQLERCRTLCELKRYAEALSALQPLVAARPEDPDVLCVIAQAELGLGNLESALAAASSAIAVAPGDEWPHRLASICFQYLGRHKEAIGHACEAVRLCPLDAVPHLRVAQALVAGEGDLTEAQQASEEAISLAPHSPEVFIVASQVALARGNRSDAEAAALHALKLDPQSASAHNELARVKLDRAAIFRPGGLAAAAHGFATSAGVGPDAQAGRQNLEMVMRQACAWAAYLIFLDAFLVGRHTAESGDPGLGFLAPGLLVIPALFLIRFVWALPPALRTHMRRILVIDRAVLAATICELSAVGLLVASALAAPASVITLVNLAAVSSVAGRVLLWAKLRKLTSRPIMEPLSSAFLWLIALALVFFGVMIIIAPGGAGAELARALFGGTLAIGGLSVAAYTALRGRRDDPSADASQIPERNFPSHADLYISQPEDRTGPSGRTAGLAVAVCDSVLVPALIAAATVAFAALILHGVAVAAMVGSMFVAAAWAGFRSARRDSKRGAGSALLGGSIALTVWCLALGSIPDLAIWLDHGVTYYSAG